MSRSRMINTKFWDDNYTSNLDPIEKLLFLYFLTNTSTNISGIYEIPLKKIAVETGIDKEMILKILERFTKDQKIFYLEGWIGVKNFIKNQNQGSSKVQVGIKNEIKLIPKDILDKFIGYGYPIASNLIESNLTESNTGAENGAGEEEKGNKKKAAKFSKEGADILKAFEAIDVKNKTYYANKTQREACDFLIKEYGFDQVMKLIPKLKGSNMKSVYQITTPWEMKEKITKVFNDVKRQASQKDKGRGYV